MVGQIEDIRRHPFVAIDAWKTVYLREPDGSPDMNIDASATPVIFSVGVPEGFVFLAYRVCFALIDNTAMNADEFGGIAGGGLTNGCLFYINDAAGNMRKDLFDGVPIKRNGQFANFAGVDVANLGGNRGIGVRWTWSRSTGGRPIFIPPGHTVNFEIRDDLDRLVSFTVMIQGILAYPDLS